AEEGRAADEVREAAPRRLEIGWIARDPVGAGEGEDSVRIDLGAFVGGRSLSGAIVAGREPAVAALLRSEKRGERGDRLAEGAADAYGGEIAVRQQRERRRLDVDAVAVTDAGLRAASPRPVAQRPAGALGDDLQLHVVEMRACRGDESYDLGVNAPRQLRLRRARRRVRRIGEAAVGERASREVPRRFPDRLR